MAVIRWDPWGELAALQRDVNELLQRSAQPGARSSGIAPPIDAYSTEDGLVVRVELPGMRPDDVEVSVHDGVLTVSGERQEDTMVGEENWLRRERHVGRFERSFTLPKGTDPERIEAAFEHGLLELRIPHPPERKPRKIEVSGETSRQGTSGGSQTIDVTAETSDTSRGQAEQGSGERAAQRSAEPAQSSA